MKKPKVLQNEYNDEDKKEKPIVEANSKNSEDVHGNDEITQSIDDQRYSEQQHENKDRKNLAKQQNSHFNSKNQNSESQQCENNKDGNIQALNENIAKQFSSQNQGNSSQQQDNEYNDSSFMHSLQNLLQTFAITNKDIEGKKKEKDKEKDNEDKTSEEQSHSNVYNVEQVVDLEQLNFKSSLYLSFYRLIEYLSDEEKNLSLQPSGSLTLNVKKLMLRQYERKSLNSYYNYKVRSKIVILLDNSGSMDWLVEELNEIFNASLKRKDVEIYIAPNGYIEEKWSQKTKHFNVVRHDNALIEILTLQLPIIYIGDYDGADTPVVLSWKNKVFWLCTEKRYRRFRSHDWVHYTEQKFRGFFARCFNRDDIIQALQLFSKNIHRFNYWYDPHEYYRFDDDKTL